MNVESRELTDAYRFALCSFCGRERAVWVHELDSDKLHYRAYGRGQVLSGAWCLCQVCEDASRSGDENRAVARMMVWNSEWNIPLHMAERSGAFNFDLEESVRKPLRVFRAADLGPQRIDDQ